ncbi:MAG: hypothetical protein KDC98_07585 [Planctomycetes bacterium]|nr:hypothetical protein [Planctomycetota bacterium]
MVHRAIAALLLLGFLGAQEHPVVTCRACYNHGSQPCAKHGKMLELEQVAHGTLFCSEVAACKSCGGALAIDCKRCSNHAVELELERRKELVATWLQQRRKDVDAITANEPLMHLQTAHCDLTFSIRPLTVGRKKLDTHELMHLYGERIESLRALFCETLELSTADLPGRLEVYMFRDQHDHATLGPRVTGISTSGAAGTKLMGVPCIYCMWQDPRLMAGDEELHRTLVHSLAHILFSNMVPSNWLGNRNQGWLDAGIAHWFEDKVTGKCANFCFEEILLQPGAGFKGGVWRTPVRKMVDAGLAVSFAELSQRNTDQLSFEEHALSFALVDFLLSAHGGAKFRDFVRLIKRDSPTRDALQKVYGLNPLSIDEAFKAWVKENYSLRAPR